MAGHGTIMVLPWKDWAARMRRFRHFVVARNVIRRAKTPFLDWRWSKSVRAAWGRRRTPWINSTNWSGVRMRWSWPFAPFWLDGMAMLRRRTPWNGWPAVWTPRRRRGPFNAQHLSLILTLIPIDSDL